jgi:nicotinate-nucleotide--dimethylbenzimidazole phosphoribosyltransferase
MKLEEMVDSVVDADQTMMRLANDRQQILTKPPGSLGDLERVAAQMAAITRRCPPLPPQRPEVILFASDHGVVSDGVTPWPQTVTAQMVANIATGGAAINAIAQVVGATVHVVDVGVASDLTDSVGVIDRKIRRGTSSLAHGPAMSIDEARHSVEIGFDFTSERCRLGADLLVTGEMGIGNTTASAAIIAAATMRSAREVTGRGTGIDDEHFERKVLIVERALARYRLGAKASKPDALAMLSELGGFEIGAIAGTVLAAAHAGRPVLVDGVIALAGVVVAATLQPRVLQYCIAGHRSSEPGASIALEFFKLTPLLELALRLGEGTGAALAVPLVQAACATISEMATFEDAGVSQA